MKHKEIINNPMDLKRKHYRSWNRKETVRHVSKHQLQLFSPWSTLSHHNETTDSKTYTLFEVKKILQKMKQE